MPMSLQFSLTLADNKTNREALLGWRCAISHFFTTGKDYDGVVISRDTGDGLGARDFTVMSSFRRAAL